MTLTHWELRALIRHQLTVLDRIAEGCPQPEAIKDLQPNVNRLNEIVAAYVEMPKEEVDK